MRSLLVLTLMSLVLGSTGCMSMDKQLDPVWESVDIPKEFRPLERVRARGNVASKSTLTTIGTTVYVYSLDRFRERFPFMEARYRAVMRHEQEHSRRQLKTGVVVWTAKYLVDRDFMWKEEQIGWYWEIKERGRLGLGVVPGVIGETLSNYSNISGRMISAAKATAWVKEVMAGRWTP
jgi:hypothetical protein